MIKPRGISLAVVRSLSRTHYHWLLFISVLALGIFARTWEFGRLPPGLNQDEASNGVDARSLLLYGTDRSGVSFPVKFVSWGGGQDALYGYLLVPLVAVLGLSPTVIRLPMLVCGILSVPLVYIAAKETFDRRLGLLSMFFLAISPWHILLSRWALEANLLPFVFLLAYTCLLRAARHPHWFVPACMFLGISLYAYGTAYAAVPVFMALAVLLLHRKRLLPPRDMGIGLITFLILAAPIGLLLLVNTLRLDSMMLGPITIPRFPVQARYEAATVIGTGEVLRAAAANLGSGIRLLATESDGILYNGVDPFGYFYRVSLILALLGIFVSIRGMATEARVQELLLLAWLGAACVIPIFQDVNINRFNLILIPLLLCAARAVDWLGTHSRIVVPAAVLILLGAFAAFTVAYHGTFYRKEAQWKFHDGLLGALQFAAGQNTGPICVTDTITMPYIFALFADAPSSADFISTVEYVDPQAPLRQVSSYGRYTFGSRDCTPAPQYTYVLAADEIPPRLGNRYKYQFFDNFVVFYARP